MSILIDHFLREAVLHNIEVNGRWWIAKPIEKRSLKSKIKDCYRILTESSFACHYYEDSEQIII